MASVLFTATAQESLAGIFACLAGTLSNPQAAKTLERFQSWCSQKKLRFIRRLR